MGNSRCVALALTCVAGFTLTACVTSIQPSPPNVPLTPVGEPPPSTVELSIALPLKAQLAQLRQTSRLCCALKSISSFLGRAGRIAQAAGSAVGTT
jgi:hypothetical protein